jgi:hypothetical protein
LDRCTCLSQFISSKIRNRLKPSTSEKIQFVSQNNNMKDPLNVDDPGYDLARWLESDPEWCGFLEDDEVEQSGPSILREVKCYVEGGERELIAKEGALNRFKLDEKLKGVHFYDDDEDDEEAKGNWRIETVVYQRKGSHNGVKFKGGHRAKAVKLEFNEKTAVWEQSSRSEMYIIDEHLYTMIRESALNGQFKLLSEDAASSEEMDVSAEDEGSD